MCVFGGGGGGRPGGQDPLPLFGGFPNFRKKGGGGGGRLTHVRVCAVF